MRTQGTEYLGRCRKWGLEYQSPRIIDFGGQSTALYISVATETVNSLYPLLEVDQHFTVKKENLESGTVVMLS